jgi:hypothetical protein
MQASKAIARPFHRLNRLHNRSFRIILNCFRRRITAKTALLADDAELLRGAYRGKVSAA